MHTIYHDIRKRGGVAATYELLRDGHNSHQLTRAVRSGEIRRARQGHYVIPELHPLEFAAVRVGGRLSGVSGAAQHGLWTPVRALMHVAVPHDARALRSPRSMRLRLTSDKRGGVTVSWISRHDSGTRSLVGVIGCLLDIATTEPANVAFASLESALFLGKVTRREWHRASELLPQTLRCALEGAGTRSESGGESLASFGLRREGIAFRQQVQIPGVGRVDIVVGRSLVVEIDGARFHTEREKFEEDRRRDAMLSTLGYRVLRFSYTQVADRWGEVLAAVRASLSRGDHWASPMPRALPTRATPLARPK